MGKKVKRIELPARIRITPKISYEIVFTDTFTDPDVLGEMRIDTKQIVIKNGLSNTDLMKTFIHEIIHMCSDEHGAKLTETQVGKMEIAIYRLLRLNNYI